MSGKGDWTLTCSVGLCDVWKSRMPLWGDILLTCVAWGRIETHVSNLSLIHKEPEATDQVTLQKTWQSKNRTRSRSSESRALNFLHTKALSFQHWFLKPCILLCWVQMQVGFQHALLSDCIFPTFWTIRTVNPVCWEWECQLGAPMGIFQGGNESTAMPYRWRNKIKTQSRLKKTSFFPLNLQSRVWFTLGTKASHCSCSLFLILYC